MRIVEGKTYRCINGDIFTVKKNHLPKYCFSVDEMGYNTGSNKNEVWTDEGISYHDDCGYNFVEEVY